MNGGAWIDRAAERAVRLGELRPAIGVLAALERVRDGTLADAQPYVVANITSRGDPASGMHALAIQVDPAAYRAVKAEALQRGSSIPTVIGERLSQLVVATTDRLREDDPAALARTGEGRKANQHRRIDIEDEGWLTGRRDAIRHGVTIARWIGLILETWAQHRDVEES